MDTPSSADPGLLGSLRTLTSGILESAHDRIALISTELQEEKFRLIQIFIWISAAVFTAIMAVTFASLTIVFAFWESNRIAALGGLTALYIGGVIFIILGFRRFLARQPRPFDATIRELKEDAECIRPQK
jgi:uncharacterized membrane protein YqjE